MLELLTDPAMLSDFLATSLRLSVPVIFAALGGMLAERSGVFNIGLEGMMLAGALGAAVGTFLTDSAFVGVLFGLSGGMLLALVLAFMAVSLGVNQIVAGIAINLFSSGITAFLARIVFGAQANSLSLPGYKTWALPGLASIPVIGPVLFNQNALVYVLYAFIPIAFWFMFKTLPGLYIRACGENPKAVDSAGLSVSAIRYWCVIGSGALAGMGGTYLVLSHVYLFSENMSAGKGFIALAAVILGRWHPLGVVAACLLFGFFDALQLRLQFMSSDIPHQIFVTLPYVVSIVALVGLIGKPRQPAATGLLYNREGR